MTNFTYKGARVASISRISKWTWGAFDAEGTKLCSAPSQPKLEAKLDKAAPKKVAKVKKGDSLSDQITTQAKLTSSKKGVKVKKAKKEKTAKKEKAAASPKKKKLGSIKHLTISLITSGKEDEEIVKEVKLAFPESKFNFNHISWYRSTLFRDGIIGPEHAPRRTHAYKDWRKTQK